MPSDREMRLREAEHRLARISSRARRLGDDVGAFAQGVMLTASQLWRHVQREEEQGFGPTNHGLIAIGCDGNPLVGISVDVGLYLLRLNSSWTTISSETLVGDEVSLTTGADGSASFFGRNTYDGSDLGDVGTIGGIGNSCYVYKAVHSGTTPSGRSYSLFGSYLNEDTGETTSIPAWWEDDQGNGDGTYPVVGQITLTPFAANSLCWSSCPLPIESRVITNTAGTATLSSTTWTVTQDETMTCWEWNGFTYVGNLSGTAKLNWSLNTSTKALTVSVVAVTFSGSTRPSHNGQVVLTGGSPPPTFVATSTVSPSSVSCSPFSASYAFTGTDVDLIVPLGTVTLTEP